MTPDVPRPPSAIEAEKTEQEVRDRLARSLFGGWVRTSPETGEDLDRLPYIDGVSVEEVRLEGTFPDTEICVLFRADGHADALFGRRQRIWEESGALSNVIEIMDVNLKEDVEACGYGLPDTPVPDASGTVWF